MTSTEAKKEIQKLLAHARDLITQAEKLANDHQVTFYFAVDYGMGGEYDGGNVGTDEHGWNPSSHNC